MTSNGPGDRAPDHHERPLKPARVTWGARGAIASPHHLASEVGLAALRAGGNAVDAAIATNAALAVVASDMCGLGGDAFWLIAPPAEPVVALNGSGRSAGGATIEAARAAGLARMTVRGPWTVTVPGAVHSWGEAHARYGNLPWSELLLPAAELADAFPASALWSAKIERAASLYGDDGDWARTFRPHGRPWRVGEVVRLPALARTLRRLAAEGADAAYTGDLAAAAAAYLASRGSPIRREDLAEHRSDWTDPIGTTYRGVTSLSHPPNSVGVIALQLLNVLERFPPPAPAAFTDAGVTDVDWIHAGLEAARITFGERDALVTDLDAMPPDALSHMLSAEWAEELAARIDLTRAAPPPPSPVPAGGGTIYLATADRWGGAVSLIESNYAGFGSGLVDPGTGIAYQNRGAFFVLDPRHANALAPRKRTMHTLTPGMLLRDGRPWIVHGQMGGEIQPQVFAQFVSAIVDGGLDVAEAVTIPRWAADVPEHHGVPDRTVLEARSTPELEAALAERGHRVVRASAFDSGLGHAHAIELVLDARAGTAPGERHETLTFAAAADPRSEGAAVTW